MVGLSWGLRSLEGTEGGFSGLSGEGLLMIFRAGEGVRTLLLWAGGFTVSCEGLRGRGGFMEVLVPFLGGNSGGSSSWSRLLREADLTVTILEEEVRESLLDATLCLEGEPGEVLTWLTSSLEAEDLVLLVGDLLMVWEGEWPIMLVWEADLAKFPVLMEILLWIFDGGVLEGRDFLGWVRVPVRVTGVRGGGGGGESSSLASALLVGTVIWR